MNSVCCFRYRGRLVRLAYRYINFDLHIFTVSLIGVDVGNTSTRISRFANYLRNLLPSNDVGVMEMAAKAVGRLALASGTYTAEYVEYEMKRVFEWLAGDRHEGKRHAAVSRQRISYSYQSEH